VATPGSAGAGGTPAVPSLVATAYLHAQNVLAVTRPGCHLDWTLLAGIGEVESDQADNGALTADGTTLKPILGPLLDGSDGTADLPDGHGGYQRAEGPMQFLPSTWAVWGADGNGDGRADINNIFDASLAAADYLCADGRNLQLTDDLDQAVLSYNDSTAYLNEVLSWSYQYAAAGTPTGAGAAPVAQLQPGQNPDTIPLADLLQQLPALSTAVSDQAVQVTGTSAALTAAIDTTASTDEQLDAAQTSLTAAQGTAALIAVAQYRERMLIPLGQQLTAALFLPPFGDTLPHLQALARAQAATISGIQSQIAQLTDTSAADAAAVASATTASDSATAAHTAAQQLLQAAEHSVQQQTGATLATFRMVEQGTVAPSTLLPTAPSLPGSTAVAGTPQAVAVNWALAQLGRPYLWGATGPDAFDCSGLVMQAWAQAGVTIPRTSQDQWADLPHVPLDQIQAGDLVIYYHDASHVAMYIGDGKVVQAPRPGAVVDVAPIDQAYILGVVRPDAGGA
jgi:cell wall-associated NlpC family hydrolase